MSSQKKNAKLYTYHVSCYFKFQFTFTDEDVAQDPEAGEGDVAPTDDALRSLEEELEECIGEQFSVSKLEVDASADDLLGITEEED